MSTNNSIMNAVLANPAVPDEEAAAFFATNEWRYMELRWRPVLPARVWAVLSCLYDHIRFNKQTWEKKEICWPSLGEIAARTRMDERTVRRILHRDERGRFTYLYRSQVYWVAGEDDQARYIERHDQARAKARARQRQQRQMAPDAAATTPPKPITCPFRAGELIAGDVEEIPAGYAGPVYTLGDLIGLFIRDVSPRYHFSATARQWQRTSNAYTVAAIVPPVPDVRSSNDVLISLADVRAARQKLHAEQAENHAPSDHRARTNWPVQSTDKLAEEATLLKPHKTENEGSISQEVVESATIGKISSQRPGRTASPPSKQPANRDDEDATTLTLSHHIEQATTPAARRSLGLASKNAAAPGVEPDAPADLLTPLGADAGSVRPAPVAVVEELPPVLPASAFLRESEILRIQADAVVGKAIAEIAAQVMKDKNPQAARAQVVKALADAHTPLDQLIPALYLGRNRVARFLCAGGSIKKTLAGYFLNTMRNLAKEGRGIGYEFAKQDTAEHVAHVAEDAGDYGYIQTPSYRHSPQRSINPRSAQIRSSFDLAYQNQQEYYGR